MNKAKLLVTYSASVVMAPTWAYVFCKQCMKYFKDYLFSVISDEKPDENIYSIILLRHATQEFSKRYGAKVKQLKAQGYSNSEISRILDVPPLWVKIALNYGE